jgi:uncharacterized membrane-anchored protein
MKTRYFVLLTLAFITLASSTHAQTSEDAAKIVNSLRYQDAQVNLSGGLATVTPSQNFSFLDAKDTAKFLTQLWGNPPETSEGVLGSIIPKDVSLADAGSWAIIISYDDSGHVSDEEAASIDYDDLLNEMQQAIRDGNEERAKQGYATYELIGWAETPHYDSETKKLYWAQRLKFSDSDEQTLNYEIRVLGRSGVIDLNVVASIDSLDMVRGRIGEILELVQFTPGNTYHEFDAGTDKLAAYGLTGLIAGGVLAKVGFFKWLLISLLAFKKFIIIGVVAVFGVIANLFRRRSS